MAEYIDREKIFPNGVFYVNEENPLTSLNALINHICNLPTADVVPKSDAEFWKQSSEEFAKVLSGVLRSHCEVRQEVAREIFADIETCMKDFEDDDDGYILKKCEFEFFMRELKKKYTEKECTSCAHFVGCETACGGRICDEYKEKKDET